MRLPELIILAALLGSTACEKAPVESRTPAAVREDWRTGRDAARRALTARLDVIDRRLEELSNRTGPGASREARESLDRWKASAKEVRDRTARLEESAEQEWRGARNDLDNAARKLEADLRTAWQDGKKQDGKK